MSLPTGVHLTIPPPKGSESILSTDAIEFLALLHRTFDAKRKELLQNRTKVQIELDKVGWWFEIHMPSHHHQVAGNRVFATKPACLDSYFPSRSWRREPLDADECIIRANYSRSSLRPPTFATLHHGIAHLPVPVSRIDGMSTKSGSCEPIPLYALTVLCSESKSPVRPIEKW